MIHLMKLCFGERGRINLVRTVSQLHVIFWKLRCQLMCIVSSSIVVCFHG